jgi:hypothetical protein
MPKSLNWHLFHKSGALEFLNEASEIKSKFQVHLKELPPKKGQQILL